MILVWAYKEFQKGKEGSKGWNDGMIALATPRGYFHFILCF
jgi:hypothetical protein